MAMCSRTVLVISSYLRFVLKLFVCESSCHHKAFVKQRAGIEKRAMASEAIAAQGGHFGCYKSLSGQC